PRTPEHSYTRELRVRHDKVDQHGTVTIRYMSKLHHIGMGRALNGTRVILLVAGRQIRVRELLRQLRLDPSRDYQPRGTA
ncbi:MAG: transposase, partial [Actinomycetota bacterium]|nr:transposase [Actinomycetota bacterium]